MKQPYFYNDDNGNVIIVDLATLEKAERGETYLPPLSWWELGEFENAKAAHDKYTDLQAEHRYCLAHDC